MNKLTRAVIDDLEDLTNNVSFRNMPYHEKAQCEVGEIRFTNAPGDDIYEIEFLKSYRTIVCGIVRIYDSGYQYKKTCRFCSGTYSRTTIKHIGWFTRYIDTDCSYQFYKLIHEKCDGWVEMKYTERF